jgi:hypothetical protein
VIADRTPSSVIFRSGPKWSVNRPKTSTVDLAKLKEDGANVGLVELKAAHIGSALDSNDLAGDMLREIARKVDALARFRSSNG